MRKTAALACSALALALAYGEPSRAGPYSTEAAVDWKARTLSIRIELDLASAGLKLPGGRLTAERMIERDVPALAKEAVFALQADSHRTIEDAAADGSIDPEALLALASLARAEASSFSKDLRKYLVTYSLSLDAIASLFLSGASPAPIKAPLESRPTRQYSGIVVYAKGSLPVRGEGLEGRAAPCLFPRIFDSDMNLILDRSVASPEALSAGGVLGYASALGADAGARVGADPMRVMALELFGDARTDFVISRDDALRILSSPGNRELLRQCKVVVIY
jgi:hypothetical protein